MFVTDEGVLYISDHLQHRMLRWPPGAVEGTVVAGGHGKGSMLNQLSDPSGLWVSSNGDVLIADFANHRVVKWPVSATTGVVVAGGHGAGDEAYQLNGPVSLVVD